MIHTITEAVKSYYEYILAILAGIAFQIAGTNKAKIKSLVKHTLSVAASSIFVALYIIRPLIAYFNITNIYIQASMLALSSLVSAAILSTLIAIAPAVFRKYLFKLFDIEED